jgi:flagellar basal-body rod protein FlgF
MDKLAFVAMNGANSMTQRVDAIAHNLANLNTNGFKAQLTAFRAAPALGDGAKTRVHTVESTPRPDYTTGPMLQTGRNLDVAVQGSGWLTVQLANGQEAYTRDGNLMVNPQGVLVNPRGQAVLTDQGDTLLIDDNRQIEIARDGTVSVVPLTGQINQATILGKLKLVNPEASQITRREDGLFTATNGRPLPDDNTVALASGYLEGSNVNSVDALVGMIKAQRMFESHMKLIQTADQNSQAANQLLTIAGT